jgi:hypothetical protein
LYKKSTMILQLKHPLKVSLVKVWSAFKIIIYIKTFNYKTIKKKINHGKFTI